MRPGLLLQKINCPAPPSDNPRFKPRSGGPLMYPQLPSYMITALKIVRTTICRHTASHSRRVLSFSFYTIPCAVHKEPLNQTERMWANSWTDKNNLMHFTSQGTHILVTAFRRRQHGTCKTKLLYRAVQTACFISVSYRCTAFYSHYDTFLLLKRICRKYINSNYH